VQHGHERPPAAQRECAQRERHRGAEREEDRRDHRQHHVLDHVDRQQRRVVRLDAGQRHQRDPAQARPEEEQRPRHRPPVAAALQPVHPRQVRDRDGEQQEAEKRIQVELEDPAGAQRREWTVAAVRQAAPGDDCAGQRVRGHGKLHGFEAMPAPAATVRRVATRTFAATPALNVPDQGQ
jgi:hypothetical protein